MVFVVTVHFSLFLITFQGNFFLFFNFYFLITILFIYHYYEYYNFHPFFSCACNEICELVNQLLK